MAPDWLNSIRQRGPAIKINGFYHTGFTVSDIHRSIAWYTRVLDMQVIRQPKEVDSPWLAAVVGYPSVRIILGMVGIAGGHSIELLQYVEPHGYRGQNRNRPGDVGAAHAGMLVDDVRGWYSRIKDEGGWVSGEPTLRDLPYPWGRYAFYSADPDGHYLEMVERSPRPEGSKEN